MSGSQKNAADPPTDTFETLYEGYRAKVYRVVLRLVKNPSDAEDLTQETFLKVQKSLSRVRRPGSVSTWLYRIATNTALDFLRQSSSRRSEGTAQLPIDTAEAVPSDIPSPSGELDNAESATAIRDNADQLPEQYRLVLVLHDLEGLPLDQVAEVLGSTVGATKVRLHRARKRFAQICRDECEQFYNEDGVLSCQLKAPAHSLRLKTPVAIPTQLDSPVRKASHSTDLKEPG
jgi:RNA polymerase sigma-70 factor (ECF subfamily)